MYRILCERTFNWGINSHINDLTCLILSVTLLYGNFFGIKEMYADSFNPLCLPCA